jgi:hypothetical protein
MSNVVKFPPAKKPKPTPTQSVTITLSRLAKALLAVRFEDSDMEATEEALQLFAQAVRARHETVDVVTPNLLRYEHYLDIDAEGGKEGYMKVCDLVNRLGTGM